MSLAISRFIIVSCGGSVEDIAFLANSNSSSLRFSNMPLLTAGEDQSVSEAVRDELTYVDETNPSIPVRVGVISLSRQRKLRNDTNNDAAR